MVRTVGAEESIATRRKRARDKTLNVLPAPTQLGIFVSRGTASLCGRHSSVRGMYGATS